MKTVFTNESRSNLGLYAIYAAGIIIILLQLRSIF